MDADTVQQIVQKEVARSLNFTCSHGITRDNLASFLVTPFAVRVDPDDLETDPREMWVVLQERSNPKEGYVAVYDPRSAGWGIAEHHEEDNYVLVIAADSLADALVGM